MTWPPASTRSRRCGRANRPPSGWRSVTSARTARSSGGNCSPRSSGTRPVSPLMTSGLLMISRSASGWRRSCASEERRRLILDNAHDAFVAMSADGLIAEWNRQAEITFGWPRAEAVGRVLSETIIPPQFREAHSRRPGSLPGDRRGAGAQPRPRGPGPAPRRPRVPRRNQHRPRPPGRALPVRRLHPRCDRTKAGRGRAAPGQGGGGGGQPGQGRVPGQRQPRDPHPHERHPRHDRAGPRHAADRGPAAVPEDGQVGGRHPARHHQRPARLLQDRGRQAGAGPGRLLPAGGGRATPCGPWPCGPTRRGWS